MARFYGTIRGNRGEASRLGTPSSGIRSHTRGWHVGGDVEIHARGDKDTVVLSLSGGSSGERNLGVEIAAFEEQDGRIRFIVRMPGNVEAHGYVGDAQVKFYQRNAEWDQNEPDGRLFYTTGKS